jgi:hypothetical protein
MISKETWLGIWILLFAVVVYATSVKAEQRAESDIKVIEAISPHVRLIRVDKPKPTYEERLGKWVDRLIKKESCGEGIIDTNGLHSRGLLCFQDRTYATYSKKYGVYDQRELAIAMILDDYGNFRHWLCSTTPNEKQCPAYTLGKGIGPPPKQ